jgi:hypothetical protein
MERIQDCRRFSMRSSRKLWIAGTGMLLMAGCVVREEPRHARVYVEPAVVAPAPPPPVVYEEAQPPGYVEVVPAAPGPEFVWEPSGYVIIDGHRRWHRGYWRHR